MRWSSLVLFILFNIYLVESGENRTAESEITAAELRSEKSVGENVAEEKSDDADEVVYEDYEYLDDGSSENAITGKSERVKGNATETATDTRDGFPNEVFLSLRNITADAATAFRGFTSRNDVADLQASASDNLNATATNDTYGDSLESAGINLRALRDAGHPPEIIQEPQGEVYLPYKHAKIDTADLSDCALQGEWKPMGVAHGHLHVAGDNAQPAEILQSVGSYAVPNKLIPHWGQNYVAEQDFQEGHAHGPPNHKPAAPLPLGGGYGSNSGFGGGSGGGGIHSGGGGGGGIHSGGGGGGGIHSGGGGGGGIHSGGGGGGGIHSGSGGGGGIHSGGGSGAALNHHYGGGISGYAGSSSGHFQKIKSGSMLSPPPLPPIIFGKKPGYWKSYKSKHKPYYDKRKRPVGFSGAGSFGFGSHGSGGSSGIFSQGGGSGHFGHVSGAVLGGSSSLSGHFGHGGGHSVSGPFVYGSGGGSGYLNHGGGKGHSFLKLPLGHGGGVTISGGSGPVAHGPGSGHSLQGSGYGSGGVSSDSGDLSLGSGGGISGGSGYLSHGSGGGISGGSGHLNLGSGGGISGGSGYLSHGSGGGVSGGTGHLSLGSGGGDLYSSTLGHGSGGGVSVSGASGHFSHGPEDGHSILGSSTSSGSFGHESGNGITISGASGHINHGAGGGNSGSLAHYVDGGAGGHLVSGSSVLSGHLNQGFGGGDGVLLSTPAPISAHTISGHLISAHGGGGNGAHGKAPFRGHSLSDSTFSSTHINQGPGNALPDAAFLSSHINQDFAVHGQGISDDLSSSSTFTCGKNHDHNTNYHTATFQVADHDHPSSVDVLQYRGDAAVLIQAADAPFHDQVLPERKHYKTWSDKGDSDVSGSDNRDELSSQAAPLTSNPEELEPGQTETEQTKLGDDGEEPERHSYYHEITKVTKIPATSVGSVQYTYSEYETKPQSFTQDTETNHEETDAEQPQIIRELEQLSNKFQLDLENPQKLFEDPPSQELAYHYPFHVDHHEEVGHQEGEKIKDEGHDVITEYPHYVHPDRFTSSRPVEFPLVYHKKPQVKYIPRPGKPQFYQKTNVNYLQPKPPGLFPRKHKPKHYLKKKQNYEVHEHSGERHRPVGEIFPPQKFPKQFHNPKPNFAVDRPKNGWRPPPREGVHLDYKYDYSHGKKVKKYKSQKQKILAPVLIRRPVSEKISAPVIRVVGVAG